MLSIQVPVLVTTPMLKIDLISDISFANYGGTPTKAEYCHEGVSLITLHLLSHPSSASGLTHIYPHLRLYD